MRAILVIVSALAVAFLLVSFLKSWQIRKAINQGQPPEKIKNNYILGAVVVVVVFAFGVWWIEWNSASPNSIYSPAKIENGNVTGGVFDQPK